MLTNNSSTASNSLHWYDFDAFRFVLIANAIVATYSLVEMGASVWEISRGATLLPEIFHVWFDFGHDQHKKGFAMDEMKSSVFGTAGVRVPAIVSKLGRDRIGKDVKGIGYVQGRQLVLHPVRRRDRLGVRWIPVPRVFISVVGLPGRLLYHQRLSFSSLKELGGKFGCETDVFAIDFPPYDLKPIGIG
ncbi:CASP-like protein 4C1 [Tripterygium wilfordii]|uniref:CASP-like protein n=1 Tax=Tripterygium wilfordii TaxID=458696 RepID=A0A7J7D8K8_TRIWF|nr:CASP-like protein 4C1 [Tripterygium wilfordii]